MKSFVKKLLSFVILITILCSFVASAATYTDPSSTYDIYNLVRSASKCDGCTQMVPQGITFANKYLLISACCEEANKHKSVIYVFNESDKSYYGTIRLENTKHVGGIAYDCNADGNIWVSNGAGVGCFKYSKLAECKGKVKDVSYIRSVNLSYPASTMCYDAVNDCLWIGHYYNPKDINDKEDVSVRRPFARCYGVGNKTSSSPTLPYKFEIQIPEKAQGISVRGNRMMISTSYGRANNSTLYSYTWNQSTKTKSLKSTKTLPPMSEGVVMGTTYAYIVYESVSDMYYNRPDKNGNYCEYPVRYFAAYKISNFGI